MTIDQNEDAALAVDEVAGAPPIEALESDDKALPSGTRPAGSEGAPMASPTGTLATFAIRPAGEPQERRTKFYAADSRTGAEFYVGQIAIYNTRRGISRRSNALLYDRHAAADSFEDWAPFIWPTVMGESNGQQVVINAWDRAHFAWGFYQLAAHTPDDNLILLMRELVRLPSAKTYFPDLSVVGGRLARTGPDDEPVSLETTTTVPVGSGTETQIVDFMAYLNPSSTRLDEREVVTCTKFIAWASDDPMMLAPTGRVSIEIMKRKFRSRASQLGLIGERPELAIWVSDIYHHGRGSTALIRDALAQPTFAKRLDALGRIDRTGNFAGRRETVARAIEELMEERRFDGVVLGSGRFALP